MILRGRSENQNCLKPDNGVETIFVTSGVHKREDIQRLGVFPDHVVDDLRELIG